MFMQMLPTLVDASVLENEQGVLISCGARHTAMLTGLSPSVASTLVSHCHYVAT